MCPKRQIISLYHDGEIPSPWKEKMEAHVESCPKCRAVLAEYGCLGKVLKSDPEKAAMEAQERVWKKLTSPKLVIPGAESHRTREKIRNRNITLPLPVAAAAVLVIIASLALVGINTLSRPPAHNTMTPANIALDDQGIVPVNDIAGVIQFLSDQGLGEFMVIRLPAETPRFSRTGEPVLINAADYSRRNTFR